MNDRQKALLAYLFTIKPHLAGAKTPDEMIKRIVQCVGEDAGFAAEGMLAAFAQYAKGVAVTGATQIAEAVSQLFEGFFLRGIASRRKQ